jgi:hypothetical protein
MRTHQFFLYREWTATQITLTQLDREDRSARVLCTLRIDDAFKVCKVRSCIILISKPFNILPIDSDSDYFVTVIQALRGYAAQLIYPKQVRRELI